MPSVAIVGASPKVDRYAYHAVLKYVARGWTVWPVHPAGLPVATLPCYRSLTEIPGTPDIVCMYINPQAGLEMLDQIVAVHPRLLWLNPGADGTVLARAAKARGLQVIEACTLIVLTQGDPLELVQKNRPTTA